MSVIARFDFYPGDWLLSASVSEMTLAQQGLYMRLLCLQWRDGPLPKEPERIAKRAAVALEEFLALWTEPLIGCFKAQEGGLCNPRMCRDRSEAEDRIKSHSAASKKANKARWDKEVTTPPNRIRTGSKRRIRTGLRSDSPSPSPITVPSEQAAAPLVPSVKDSRSADYFEFRDWWLKTFRDVTGQPYGIDHGKDGAHIKAILGFTQGDVQAAKDRSLILLHAAPGWIAEGGKDLGTLRAQWNKLVSQGQGAGKIPKVPGAPEPADAEDVRSRWMIVQGRRVGRGEQRGVPDYPGYEKAKADLTAGAA